MGALAAAPSRGGPDVAPAGAVAAVPVAVEFGFRATAGMAAGAAAGCPCAPCCPVATSVSSSSSASTGAGACICMLAGLLTPAVHCPHANSVDSVSTLTCRRFVLCICDAAVAECSKVAAPRGGVAMRSNSMIKYGV